ncbi:MAG: response regulator [Chloroflexi bacterium]|nr:response regulator [Chloroflexota bacterium]
MPDLLLIDDNHNYQIGLSANLQAEGFHVVTAKNGNEGIKLARDSRPDLIICDLNMPAPNGLEVKRILNGEPATANIPFIFLSAYPSSKNQENGFVIGADDFITKLVDKAELVTRINAILLRKERTDHHIHQEVVRLTENLKDSLPIQTRQKFQTYRGESILALENALDDPSRSELYLKKISNNLTRMKLLENDLVLLNEFDLGRYVATGQPLDLQISFIIPLREIMELWEKKDLRLSLQVDEDVALIAPQQPFTQVVCHFVDNACKYSPSGGTIKIHLAANGQTGCVLTVQDEGLGIPQSLREQVFDRYYKIQQEETTPDQGMGLGLYLSRIFARTRGGDVKILDSDHGTIVQLTLH